MNSEGSGDQAAGGERCEGAPLHFSEHLLQRANCWGFRAISRAPSTTIKVQPIKGRNSRERPVDLLPGRRTARGTSAAWCEAYPLLICPLIKSHNVQ